MENKWELGTRELQGSPTRSSNLRNGSGVGWDWVEEQMFAWVAHQHRIDDDEMGSGCWFDAFIDSWADTHTGGALCVKPEPA